MIVPAFQIPTFRPVATTLPEISPTSEFCVKYSPALPVSPSILEKLPPVIDWILAICLGSLPTDKIPLVPVKVPPVILSTTTGELPFLPYKTSPEQKGIAPLYMVACAFGYKLVKVPAEISPMLAPLSNCTAPK